MTAADGGQRGFPSKGIDMKAALLTVLLLVWPLGPQARADFARDLSGALAQARRGPRFS